MEFEGVVPAEGCPHYITAIRVEEWHIRHGNKPTRCKGCTAEGFIPAQRLRTTRRHAYDAEHSGINIDRHSA